MVGTDQIDEKQCWQLEINECRNGQCVSKQLSIGNTKLYECLFESNVLGEFLSQNYVTLELTIVYFEDRTCSKPGLPNPKFKNQ